MILYSNYTTEIRNLVACKILNTFYVLVYENIQIENRFEINYECADNSCVK